MLFGRERETKAPSESGAASVTSTPRNRDTEFPSKLSLFSAFRTSHNSTSNTNNTISTIASSSSRSNRESNSGSTPLSLLRCRIDRGSGDTKSERIIRTDARHESESGSKRGEVLLEWEAPSPAQKWRSHTPQPLSKLKKSFSSFFQSPSSTPSSPKSPSPFSLFKSSRLSARVRMLIAFVMHF
jgi:hypothetical protein